MNKEIFKKILNVIIAICLFSMVLSFIQLCFGFSEFRVGINNLNSYWKNESELEIKELTEKIMVIFILSTILLALITTLIILNLKKKKNKPTKFVIFILTFSIITMSLATLVLANLPDYYYFFFRMESYAMSYIFTYSQSFASEALTLGGIGLVFGVIQLFYIFDEARQNKVKQNQQTSEESIQKINYSEGKNDNLDAEINKENTEINKNQENN